MEKYKCMNSIKTYLRNFLPECVASRIISIGCAIKKIRRDKWRRNLGGEGHFAKKIDVSGVQFLIVLDPVQNGGVDENIAKSGYWEKALGEQFVKNIRKGDVFLDIGANIGYHSLFVSRLVQDTGRVISFEPIPRLCAQLAESMKLNGIKNITICNFGLAERDGEAQIFLRDENTGGSSIIDLTRAEGFVAQGSMHIKLRRLDDFLKKSVHVRALKIDVEGYELEALRGGREMLSRDKPVIFIEFSPKIYIHDYNEKPIVLIDFLHNIGYSFFTLDGEDIDPVAWLSEEDNLHSQIDLMCKCK